MCLVNVASLRFDSSEFAFLAGFVVIAQFNRHLSSIHRANSPAVADVHDDQVVVVSHNKVGAASRLAVLKFLGCLVLGKRFFDVIVVSELTPFENSLVEVVRKVRLHNYVVVEVFFKVLCALIAAVAIVHCEDLDFGPSFVGDFLFFSCWLDNVQDYCNPVLVGFPDKPNVGVGCKRFDNPKLFVGGLRTLEVGQERPAADLKAVIFVLGGVNLYFSWNRLITIALLIILLLFTALRFGRVRNFRIF